MRLFLTLRQTATAGNCGWTAQPGKANSHMTISNKDEQAKTALDIAAEKYDQPMSVEDELLQRAFRCSIFGGLLVIYSMKILMQVDKMEVQLTPSQNRKWNAAFFINLAFLSLYALAIGGAAIALSK